MPKEDHFVTCKYASDAKPAECSVVLRASAVRIDLLDAAARQCRQLFHNRAIDEDPQAPTAHRSMFQRPAIDDNLARLIGGSLKCSSQRNLISRPGDVEVWHVLDAECDPNKRIWTLQSHAVDGVVHCLGEEISLANRMRRLSATRG